MYKLSSVYLKIALILGLLLCLYPPVGVYADSCDALCGEVVYDFSDDNIISLPCVEILNANNNRTVLEVNMRLVNPQEKDPKKLKVEVLNYRTPTLLPFSPTAFYDSKTQTLKLPRVEIKNVPKMMKVNLQNGIYPVTLKGKLDNHEGFHLEGLDEYIHQKDCTTGTKNKKCLKANPLSLRIGKSQENQLKVGLSGYLRGEEKSVDEQNLTYELLFKNKDGTGYTEAKVEGNILSITVAPTFTGEIVIPYLVKNQSQNLVSKPANIIIWVQSTELEKVTFGAKKTVNQTTSTESEKVGANKSVNQTGTEPEKVGTKIGAKKSVNQTRKNEDYQVGASKDSSESVEFKSGKQTSAPSTLDSKVDLSEKFPKPRDQGKVPSCVAFATAYALKSYQEGLEEQWALDNNEHLFSPAFIHYELIKGKQEFTIDSALNIMTEKGVPTWDIMPYDVNNYDLSTDSFGECKEKTCSPNSDQRRDASQYRAQKTQELGIIKISDFAKTPLLDNKDKNNVTESKKLIDDIKNALAGELNGYEDKQMPIVAGILAYDSLVTLQGCHSVYNTATGNYKGRHAVVIVGYDDSKYGGAFKVMNSWGTKWGNDGYFWLPYQFATQQGKKSEDSILYEGYILVDQDNIKRSADNKPDETMPNLEVLDWQVKYNFAQAGGKGKLEYSVINTGGKTTSKAVDVKLVLSKDAHVSSNDILIELDEKIPALKKGQILSREKSNAISFEFPDSIVTGGEYYLRLWVDASGDEKESDEEDNVSYGLGNGPINFKEALPDLMISSIKDLSEKSDVKVKISVKNDGTRKVKEGMNVKELEYALQNFLLFISPPEAGSKTFKDYLKRVNKELSEFRDFLKKDGATDRKIFKMMARIEFGFEILSASLEKFDENDKLDNYMPKLTQEFMSSEVNYVFFNLFDSGLFKSALQSNSGNSKNQASIDLGWVAIGWRMLGDFTLFDLEPQREYSFELELSNNNDNTAIYPSEFSFNTTSNYYLVIEVDKYKSVNEFKEDNNACFLQLNSGSKTVDESFFEAQLKSEEISRCVYSTR